MNTPFPVINVDDSNLKKLEGMYGTGESFVRAFKERTGQSIHNQSFMVFGFGKVGRGIVKYLLRETPHITVVDQSEKQLSDAKKWGLMLCMSLKPRLFKILLKTCFVSSPQPDNIMYCLNGLALRFARKH